MITPLYFKCPEQFILFYDEIDFLLIAGPPEIKFPELPAVLIFFSQFADDIIFPKCSGIGTVFGNGKVAGQGVDNAIVGEINFAALSEFLGKIAGK